METQSNSKSNLTLHETLYLLVNSLINETETNNSSGTTTDDTIAKLKKAKQNGEVIAIQGNDITVKLNDGSQLVITEEGYNIIFPTLNTGVEIDYNTDNEPFISKRFEVDDIYWNSRVTQILQVYQPENDIASGIVITPNEISLSTGGKGDSLESLGGLIIIQKLVDKLNKLVDEVKDINKRLGEHKHTYNAYPAVPTSSSVPEQAPMTPYIPVPDPSEFDKADFENKNIIHLQPKE